MATEIRVPTLGESVTEAIVGQWFKKPGEAVNVDEPLVELETDKVTVEVPAPAAGVMQQIAAEEGATVEVGAVLGAIDDGAAAASGTAATATETKAPAEPEPVPQAQEEEKQDQAKSDGPVLSPSARKLAVENDIAPEKVSGSGKDGRILKEDILAVVESGGAGDKGAGAAAAVATLVTETVRQPHTEPTQQQRGPAAPSDAAREERVRMTKLRQTIAKRLKDAQNTAAMLTTFNEVDMTNVMELRNQYKELFEKKHGVKLGFLGFFVKACIQALREIPAVNAEIDGTDIVYKNYYHIGVAVGTDKGLVVPVVRDADQMNLAEIERAIGSLAQRARTGKLGIEDMQGGTFTISNGGVYGSLMSTPILNAPQSGILGMHKIQQRPMVVDGVITPRPMMYLAFSYDHRIVDGKEAVTFLVRVKDSLEDPQRLVLDV